MIKGYIIIGFLPVSSSEFNADQDDSAYDIPSADSERTTVERALHYEVRLESKSDGRWLNMLVFQNSLSRAFQSLEA